MISVFLAPIGLRVLSEFLTEIPRVPALDAPARLRDVAPFPVRAEDATERLRVADADRLALWWCGWTFWRDQTGAAGFAIPDHRRQSLPQTC
jgi:hypothetical protein